jgi:hypothetical protein
LIETLTLHGNVSWTGRDGAAEELITEVRVPLPDGGYGWQPITFPFQAIPPSSYVDANGDIVVRFSDTASIKRERKDTLSVDYLVGEVVIGSTTPAPPTAPGSLAAPTVTANSVILSWLDSAGESSYLIWRYTAEAGWMVLAELAEGAVTFLDSGLTPGMSYTYAVRALNADGFADSELLSIEIAAVLVAPQNLKASPGKGVINLTWTDSNTLETAYQVLRGTTSDGNFVALATLPADAISYGDTSVIKSSAAPSLPVHETLPLRVSFSIASGEAEVCRVYSMSTREPAPLGASVTSCVSPSSGAATPAMFPDTTPMATRGSARTRALKSGAVVLNDTTDEPVFPAMSLEVAVN